jgi:RNA-directed DNA polymerase
VDTVYQADKVWLLDIQRKLYTWSRSTPDDAWRDMWNWVTQPQNLRLAWRRVASNRGARSSGVDKVTVKHIETRIGVERFLTMTRATLLDGSYRPHPVRRVMIPKRGKPGLFRPLGVPTVQDRVVQAALLQLLEPIFEAEFLTVSYGFRPKRACRDALEHIRNAIRPTGEKTETDWPRPPYQWVIEGDIKGCFDNIDHHHVMTCLRRRVADRRVTRLVRAFLKAGVLSEGALVRTKAGTPQGGVLSPLLANIMLSGIERRYGRYVTPRISRDGKPYARPGDALRKFRHYERKAGRVVFLPIRYADDFVVLVNGTEEQARAEKEELAVFLREQMKLTLAPEKTHVTALTEGFEFLGHRVRLRWDDRWGYWPRIEIPKARVKDFHHRIKQSTTRGRSRLSFQEVIDALNPVLLGWGRFYQHCYGAKQVFARIDHYVWDRLRRWLRKKYPKTPRLVIRRRYWRRLPGRARYRWVDQRPVAIVADLKVGRHDLLKMRMPDYAYPARESPVHNERCTPGSGTGAGETGGGNPDSGASPPRSLRDKEHRSATETQP